MNLSRLAVREPTMRLALSLLAEREGTTIVETGCVRQADDWAGAGMSTLIFGEWAAEHGAHLWTVDNDAAHLALAADLTYSWEPWITYHLGDSIAFLQGTPSHLGPRRINLLYLDSLDYPYGELLDLYGGKADIGKAIVAVSALTEGQVIERHHDLIAPAQRHAAKEMMAAIPYLSDHAIVLIDDAQLPGGGKARLARAVLEAEGFECILDSYQTLWARRVAP